MKFKKQISIILTAMMLLSTIPGTVFADDEIQMDDAAPAAVAAEEAVEEAAGNNDAADVTEEAADVAEDVTDDTTPVVAADSEPDNGNQGTGDPEDGAYGNDIKITVRHKIAGTDEELSNPDIYEAEAGVPIDLAPVYEHAFRNMHYKCVNPQDGKFDYLYSNTTVILYYKRYYSFEVKFLDRVSKKPIHDSIVEELFEGETRNFPQAAEHMCAGWTYVEGPTDLAPIDKDTTFELLYDPKPDTMLKINLTIVNEAGYKFDERSYDVKPRESKEIVIDEYKEYEPVTLTYSSVVTDINETVVLHKKTNPVTIHYIEYGTVNKLRDDEVIAVEYGGNFTLTQEELDNAIPHATYVEGAVGIFKMISPHEMTLRYRLDTYDVKVHFVDAETGAELRACDVVSVKHGAKFDYARKAATAVTGATLVDGEITTIDDVTENKEITLRYNVNKYDVDVRFVYGEGNDEVELAQAEHFVVKHGNTVDVECPEVEGYYPPKQKFTTDTITQNREITVVYSKNQYMVTIHYLDKDGNKLADDVMEQVAYMEGIEVDNPYIEGYKPADGADAISISNVTEDMDVNVYYVAASDDDDDDDIDVIDKDDKDAKKHSGPDTGDNEPLALMIMLMLASGAGILGLKKKEE